MKKLIKLSFVLVMVLSLGMIAQSCKTKKHDSTKGTTVPGEVFPNIDGTWILQSLNGQAAPTIFKGKIPTMNIDLAENRVFGNSGCNSYTGTFTFAKGIFAAPNLASTMMMCMDENKEDQFLAALGQSNKASLQNGDLTLSNNGKTVAVFKKGIDTSLLLGQWKLESIGDADLKTLFGDELPTIEFDLVENRFSGYAGCNRYGATYQIEGTTIAVGPVIATRMACPNMDGELKFTQIITGNSTLEATSKKLTFSKDGAVTLTFVKELS